MLSELAPHSLKGILCPTKSERQAPGGRLRVVLLRLPPWPLCWARSVGFCHGLGVRGRGRPSGTSTPGRSEEVESGDPRAPGLAKSVLWVLSSLASPSLMDGPVAPDQVSWAAPHFAFLVGIWSHISGMW